MSITNTLAILNMYRQKHVQAVRTTSGIVFMGTANLTLAQKERLLDIPQSELDKAIRMQHGPL